MVKSFDGVARIYIQIAHAACSSPSIFYISLLSGVNLIYSRSKNFTAAHLHNQAGPPLNTLKSCVSV
jgi:hypothetical protein